MNTLMCSEYKRSLLTLQCWARKALDPELIAIARAHSPNASFNRAVELGKDQKTAKATRWLAMIKRDYGTRAFEVFVTQEQHL